MWDLIINPFVTGLTFLYSVFNNDIVLAIVVLTIIIRMLTYPLLAKQQKSTAAMQKIQPELKKIQEKYKNDREKLSQAQMELYRKHGVNPVGGCLPLLIQFPILIGLYQSIMFALASTPFQLVDLPQRLMVEGFDHLIPLQNQWLGMDLALAPGQNPGYAYALPLLVVITTYIQTKFSMPSTSTDDSKDEKPNQAQAMTGQMSKIMPLMFGMFALSFSIGLSIYFIVSNVVGIVQYSPYGKRVLDRIFGDKEDDAVMGELVDDIDGAEDIVKPAKAKSGGKKKARNK